MSFFDICQYLWVVRVVNRLVEFETNIYLEAVHAVYIQEFTL